jgi:hypothetical protein
MPKRKSRLKNLQEAGKFLGLSILAIMLVLFIMGWVAYAFQASAATGINQQINYQGKLSDINGVQVGDNSWNFRFRIYDASSGGTLLWTERWTSTSTQVSTVNGVFSVTLGTITGFATSSVDFSDDSLYLQVDLDATGDGAWEESFTTRKRLTSSPYAFNADEVDGFNATNTAAVASYVMGLDAQANLNLFDQGVSSTRATTTWLYVGADATITDNLNIGGYASTTNLVLGNDGIDLGTYADLYVNSSQLYFDGTQITGANGLSPWQYAWDKAITPTSTDIGIYVTASSTIAADFRVDGNATTTGTLSVGDNMRIFDFGAASVLQNDNANITLLPASGSFVQISDAEHGLIQFGGDSGEIGVTGDTDLLYLANSILTIRGDASTTNDFVVGNNATTSGKLVVGTTNPTFDGSAGDLLVGDDATVTDSLKLRVF